MQRRDPALDTAVSHEMGHVFERQLDTLSTSPPSGSTRPPPSGWHSTPWAAGADLKNNIKQGDEFPTLQIPTGFSFGYNTEQAYAAGAFMIWLADAYGVNSAHKIYADLSGNPEYWYDSYTVLTLATGVTMADVERIRHGVLDTELRAGQGSQPVVGPHRAARCGLAGGYQERQSPALLEPAHHGRPDERLQGRPDRQ